MEIPQQLPQFEHHRALLIVTSGHEVVCYEAHKKLLSKRAELTPNEHHFTDREGFSQQNADGHMIASGASEKDVAPELFHDLMRQLHDVCAKDWGAAVPDQVIIFAPGRYKNEIAHHLPKNFQDRILAEIDGNFIHTHPQELLEKIQHLISDKSVEPVSAEAEKLMHKSDE